LLWETIKRRPAQKPQYLQRAAALEGLARYQDRKAVIDRLKRECGVR
jgi:hypothetical protein